MQCAVLSRGVDTRSAVLKERMGVRQAMEELEVQLGYDFLVCSAVGGRRLVLTGAMCYAYQERARTVLQRAREPDGPQ